MAVFLSQLESLPSRLRLRVCVESIAWTIRTLESPIQDPNVASFVSDGLARAESAVNQGLDFTPGLAEFRPRFNDLFEEAVDPGTFQFINAGLFCFANAGSELPFTAAVNILSDSYEGALYRATSASITTEVERATPRAREVIEYQQGQITDALGNAQGLRTIDATP